MLLIIAPVGIYSSQESQGREQQHGAQARIEGGEELGGDALDMSQNHAEAHHKQHEQPAGQREGFPYRIRCGEPFDMR